MHITYNFENLYLFRIVSRAFWSLCTESFYICIEIPFSGSYEEILIAHTTSVQDMHITYNFENLYLFRIFSRAFWSLCTESIYICIEIPFSGSYEEILIAHTTSVQDMHITYNFENLYLFRIFSRAFWSLCTESFYKSH